MDNCATLVFSTFSTTLNTTHCSTHKVSGERVGQTDDNFGCNTARKITTIFMTENIDTFLTNRAVEMREHRICILRIDEVLLPANIFIVNRDEFGKTRAEGKCHTSLYVNLAVGLEKKAVWRSGYLKVSAIFGE